MDNELTKQALQPLFLVKMNLKTCAQHMGSKKEEFPQELMQLAIIIAMQFASYFGWTRVGWIAVTHQIALEFHCKRVGQMKYACPIPCSSVFTNQSKMASE